MTPDVYGAWLTAGNNLQPIGAWLAGGGAWIPILAVAAVLIWRIRQAARRVVQILAEELPKRETDPGSNEDDLLTCLNILAVTDKARKENPQQ